MISRRGRTGSEMVAVLPDGRGFVRQLSRRACSAQLLHPRGHACRRACRAQHVLIGLRQIRCVQRYLSPPRPLPAGGDAARDEAVSASNKLTAWHGRLASARLRCSGHAARARAARAADGLPLEDAVDKTHSKRQGAPSSWRPIFVHSFVTHAVNSISRAAFVAAEAVSAPALLPVLQ